MLCVRARLGDLLGGDVQIMGLRTFVAVRAWPIYDGAFMCAPACDRHRALHVHILEKEGFARRIFVRHHECAGPGVDGV